MIVAGPTKSGTIARGPATIGVDVTPFETEHRARSGTWTRFAGPVGVSERYMALCTRHVIWNSWLLIQISLRGANLRDCFRSNIPPQQLLNVQVHAPSFPHHIPILLQRALNLPPRPRELVHLLGRSAVEAFRIEQLVQLPDDWSEELRRADSLHQIVVFAFDLDGRGGLVGEDADLLVGLLPGDAGFGEGHDDAFAAGEVSGES